MEFRDHPSASPSPVPSAEQDSRPDSPSLPLTLTASTILVNNTTSHPPDSKDSKQRRPSLSAALASAGALSPTVKCVIKFKPVGGNVPVLKQDVCKISEDRKFEEVVRFLRRKLGVGARESVFLYVNSAFAPSLDEVVGNLHRCFKNANEQLIVAYSITPAFG